MAKVIIQSKNDRYIKGTYNWLVIAIIGTTVGVVVWGSAWLLGQFVVDPLLCRASALQACGQSAVVAGNIGAIIGAIVGAIILIRSHVRHSLWIVFAATLAFWGISALTGVLFWVEALGWSIGLYALGYIFFTWVLRLRSLVVGAVVAIAVALLFRWIAFL